MDMRGFLFVLKENIPGRAEVSGGTGAVTQKLFWSSSRAYHRASDDANRHWSRPKLFYGSGEGGLSSECREKRFLHLVMWAGWGTIPFTREADINALLTHFLGIFQKWFIHSSGTSGPPLTERLSANYVITRRFIKSSNFNAVVLCLRPYRMFLNDRK